MRSCMEGERLVRWVKGGDGATISGVLNMVVRLLMCFLSSLVMISCFIMSKIFVFVLTTTQSTLATLVLLVSTYQVGFVHFLVLLSLLGMFYWMVLFHFIFLELSITYELMPTHMSLFIFVHTLMYLGV